MKVFVINLTRSPERKIQMKNRLTELQVEFDFFTAIDGKSLTDFEINNSCNLIKIKKNIRRSITKNEVACALSHRAIYKKIVEEKINYAIILEDDVILDNNFKAVINNLPSLKNSVIKLDNLAEKNTLTSIWHNKVLYRTDQNRTVYRLKKPATDLWVTWGYCIDYEAAKKILTHYPKIEFCADDWYKMERIISLFIVRPEIVFEQKELSKNSTIGNDRIPTPMPKHEEILKRIQYLFSVFFKIFLP